MDQDEFDEIDFSTETSYTDMFVLYSNESEFLDNSTDNYENGTENGAPPPHFTQMNENSRNLIIAYLIIFVISTMGNISVFYTVFRQLKKSKTRITLLILHLSIADLLVTFGVIPLEVIWRFTIQFYGGNILCKACLFFRAFGLYLSLNVLICICLDRYFAIVHPLAITDALRRRRRMLIASWITAMICSAPQSVIFRIQTHPKYIEFQQCVSIGYFSSEESEMLYNVFSVFMLYFLPLFVIFFSYGRILFKIVRKSKDLPSTLNRSSINGHNSSNESGQEGIGRVLLRKNDARNNLLLRAKNKTLKLTVLIVISFILCWTGYVLMTLWYMFHRESAIKVDERIQDGLFMTAVSNSMINPLIYGTFTDNMCKSCKRSNSSLRNGNSPSIYRSRKDTINSRVVMSQSRKSFKSRPAPEPAQQQIPKELGNISDHILLELKESTNTNRISLLKP